MLLYDKKDDSIDIYTLQARQEELKKYRKEVLQGYDTSSLFYCLKTGVESIAKNFLKGGDFDICDVDSRGWRKLDSGWSLIDRMSKKVSDSDIEIQKKILEKYIEGEYSSLVPSRVYDTTVEHVEYYDKYLFLKPEKIKEIWNSIIFWQINNMLNLPRNLYLLQLIELGRFEQLTKENIKEQLQLFDIDYSKRVKVSEIEELLSTSLVSGKIEDVIKKAKVGSKILQKIRK